MAGQSEPPKTGDEISLLELLATLIRRRVWVYWATGLGGLAAATLLFLLPIVGIVVAGVQTVTLQAVVRTVPIPKDAQASINFDVGALVQTQANDLRVVGGIYRTTLLTDHEAKLEKPAFNRLVKRFIDKAFRVIPDPRGVTVLLTLKVKEQDQEKGSQFLTLFATQVQADLRASTTRQIEQTIANLEGTGKPTTELGTQAKINYEVASKVLKGVLADHDFPMTLVGGIEPLDDDVSTSRGLLFVIALFGSVLLGILLAFGAEAVSRIRRDPASVTLLERAWKGE